MFFWFAGALEPYHRNRLCHGAAVGWGEMLGMFFREY